MKKSLTYLVVLAIAFLTLISCDELLGLINFDLENDSVEFVIGPASAGTHYIDVTSVETDIEQILEDNNVKGVDKIDEVILDSAILTIVSGAINFDKIESIEIRVSAEGIDEILLASYMDIPDGLTKLSLDLTDVNLADYISKDTYSVSLDAALSEDIPEVVLNAKFVYTVSL